MEIKDDLTHDILNSISEGLFTVDKYFKINFFNKSAERITGYKQEEAVGKFCKFICHSDLCQTKCPISIVLETGQNVRDFEGNIRHKNGKLVRIKLNASILRAKDESPIGGVISLREVADLYSFRNPSIDGISYHGMIGHSKSMQEIFELIEEIRDSDATVLIQGESGTGKEMIANAIQATSHRCNKEFIKINCSVFTPQLLASELFGHVKGSFTGAIKDRPGRFEIADQGTIFLDEIAEMSPEMQIQLLRVLQEGTFERVGESITRYTDVRIIAATNRKLDAMLRSGKFREDLYYRLNVIPIVVPPLREHPEDIPFLVKHFLKKYSQLYHKTIEDVSDETLDILLHYPWPGNIRELENAIEYAFVRTQEGRLVNRDKLPPIIRENLPTHRIGYTSDPAKTEAIKILELLERHHWNRTKVAKELGIGRTTLWRKMRQNNIPFPK